MKSPKMEVDLGELGTEELDFSASFKVADLDEALLQQAALYDWYDSVYNILKSQLVKKTDYMEKVSAERRREIEQEKQKTAKKRVTQKELDAALKEDAKVLTVKEELNELEYKVNRVRGHMSALGQFHSNLKELSRRERWRLSSTGDNVEDPEQKVLDRLNDKKKGKKGA